MKLIKLSITILVQITITSLSYVQSGLVNNIIGSITDEIHRVSENVRRFEAISGKERFSNKDFLESVENVNDHVNDLFDTKEQSDSSEYSSGKDKNWSHEAFHRHNNGFRKQENIHSHFHDNNKRHEDFRSLEWQFSKPTPDYNKDKYNKHDNSWESNYNTHSTNNIRTTTTSKSSEWEYSKPTAKYNTNNRENNNRHDNSWENNFKTQTENNIKTTSTSKTIEWLYSTSTSKYGTNNKQNNNRDDNFWEKNSNTQDYRTTTTKNDVNFNHNSGLYNNKNATTNNIDTISTILFPGATSGDIVNNNNNNNNYNNNDNKNETKIDKIVFPGKVTTVKQTKCPDGLVITANGQCLEQKVIYMSNRTTTERNFRI